jgi:two-component system cell cycle sensor histidine kinase/response regulator CckA
VPQRHLTFEQIVELSNEATWILDERGLTTYVNPRAGEILGYPLADIVGRPFVEFLFPAGRDRYAGRFDRLQATRSDRMEVPLRHRTGREVWCLASARSIETRDGRFAGVLVALSDLSERRESELLLRESQRIARLGSYAFDFDADRWTSSETLDEIFGIDAAYDRTAAGWLALVHADDRETMAGYLRSPVSAGDRFDRQYRIVRHSDGRERWVHGHGELQFDAVTTRATRLFGTIQDITDRRRQEEEHAQLEARMLLGQKLESLGVLAGGVAHEFNNLLTSILGNADLALHDLPANSPVRGNILAIETASQRAAEISHQMLAYSGRGRFVVEPADISQLVHDMSRMLEVSLPKGASLRFELTAGLPAVQADVAQVRQMVLNLVLNAAEALDPRKSGAVVVRTGVQACDDSAPLVDYFDQPLPAGRYVFVEVADTGAGMAPETMVRIFEPFFSTKFTGRGLGLPAALGVARGHSGYFQVRSVVGEGSAFRVLLPPATAEPSRRAAAAAPALEPALPLLLVVDDEDAVRTLTLKLIERCGYRAAGASDGLEALQILRARHAEFACVLLDLTMPRLGGEDTLEEIREFAPHLPVLISSGYEGSEVSRRLEALHVSGFIQKPYQLAELKARIGAVLAAPSGRARD